MKRVHPRLMRPPALIALCLAATLGAFLAPLSICAAQEDKAFVGGLSEDADENRPASYRVRNDVAQPGEEIVTRRIFKIKKGSFDEFLKASVEGVWPYFEKIGARVIGMWKVIHPEVEGTSTGTDDPEYDEVILMTRYASVDHWHATRDTYKHGGNGPDWDKCMAALRTRRGLTIETSLIFLQGLKWSNDPWFLPGLDEN